jgi:hypothetical protein
MLRAPTRTFIAKTYGGPWDMGAVLGRDGGIDESMSPQFGIIPSPIDQNWCAHWRNPMDMMRQG